MNWRKLIYSIIIPSVANFIFMIFISIGVRSNALVLFYAIIMMVTALLSNTGKGKNGDAISTIVMGLIAGGATWLLIEVLSSIQGFSWLFVLKTVGLMFIVAFAIWFGQIIMEDDQQGEDPDDSDDE